MKVKKKLHLLISIMGFFLVVSIISVNNSYSDTPMINETTTDENHDLTSLKMSWYNNSEDPIYIDGSVTGVGAHNWTWARDTQEWCRKGDGSWANPYVIENITIDVGGSGSGIYINNSKIVNFIIRNCTVFNSGINEDDAGIKLENTNNGTLFMNNCSLNNRHGILLYEDCNNNTISGNTANDNFDGIYLYNGCANNTISGNTANDNYNGISLYNGCDNNTISGNTAYNNWYSIHATWYWGNGILLEENCTTNTISGNTANDNLHGISLYNGCDNNTISGNNANNNTEFGILFYDSNDNKVLGNTANNHANYGIYLYINCDNNTISGNTVNDNNEFGIYLTDGCDNNTISGNTACNNLTTNQDDGISLRENCKTNTISGNTANNNANFGIYLYYSCANNIISGNTANDNNEHGIYLNRDCDNNTISGNTVNDNNEYGIKLYYNCNNNNITQNYIYYNILGAILINTIDCDNTLIKTNVLVSRDTLFILDSGTNTMIKANYYGTTPPSFVIEVSDQSFSTTEFIITINVSSQCTGLEVYNFSIQLWWNGTAVPSNDIEDIGNGLYNISLTKKFVETGEDPIRLNMTLGALYHRDKYYETYIAVEPESEPASISNLLFIEIKNQTFSMEEFNITFYLYNRENQGIADADIQMWWHGVNVSSNVVELENGLYNIMLTPLFTELGEEPILLNMSIKAIGYPDKYYETFFAVEPDTEPDEDSNELNIEILYQLFFMEEFNITSYIYNESGHAIDSLKIKMWWNGSDVSSTVQNLGSGLYFVSLEPITVKPGEDPIFLEMNIFASGYENKSFETYIAVDPDTLLGDTGKPSEDSPLLIIIITSTSIAGGIIIIGVTAFLLRRRKIK